MKKSQHTKNINFSQTHIGSANSSVHQKKTSILQEIDDIISKVSPEKDLLQKLSYAMPRQSDIPGFDYKYYKTLLKDDVTQNLAHDMVLLAMYVTFSEAMYQAGAAIETSDEICPFASGSSKALEKKPFPGALEYLEVFNKLALTYSQLSPNKQERASSDPDGEDSNR